MLSESVKQKIEKDLEEIVEHISQIEKQNEQKILQRIKDDITKERTIQTIKEISQPLLKLTLKDKVKQFFNSSIEENKPSFIKESNNQSVEELTHKQEILKIVSKEFVELLSKRLELFFKGEKIHVSYNWELYKQNKYCGLRGQNTIQLNTYDFTIRYFKYNLNKDFFCINDNFNYIDINIIQAEELLISGVGEEYKMQKDYDNFIKQKEEARQQRKKEIEKYSDALNTSDKIKEHFKLKIQGE